MIAKFVAYLCEGDDHLNIAGNVDIPAIVHGGGDDQFHGGRGPVVLLADDGNDTLIGGSSRDVLIGGTTYFDDEARMTLLAEWNSAETYGEAV